MKPFKAKMPTVLIVLFLSATVAACSSMKQTVEGMTQNMAQGEQVVPLPQELERPVPNPIGYEIPDRFKEAVESGTRTATGKPGPDYWQQYSEYYIDVKILPNKKLLKASGRIVYHNNSPDDLEKLYLELTQNFRNGDQKEVVNITKLVYNGHNLSPLKSRGDSVGYNINGTVMKVELPEPLEAGETATIKMKWSFNIPQTGADGRMGYSKGNLFFIGYWYPQMRVYDDVIGWFTHQFTGTPEFYHGFADYEVSITVPEQWIVAATGIAQNRKKLLQEEIYKRLMEAYEGTDIVRVVGPEDFGDVTINAEDGWLTWEFSAERVNDFTFSVMKESIWEATTTPVGDLDGDGETEYTHINAFFRQLAPLWDEAAKYVQHSIKFLSQYTGLSYPWPHMTAVEGAGILDGGMEYPMMTIIGPYNWQSAEPSDLYSVIAHELAHMWTPMMLASNERRYGWMNEGNATYMEGQAQQAYPLAPEFQSKLGDFRSYLRLAGEDAEGPMMRWSDYFYMGGYGIASYSKPSSVLIALKGLIGKETFMKAYRTYMDRWQYKHPYPWDLFSTFEDVANRNLDWFWRSWYYTTWVLDRAVGEVNNTANGVKITIVDKGNVPMPANVKVWLSNGKTVTRHIDVKTWLHGAVKTTLSINTKADVTRVVINPEHTFPDADRSNNFWVTLDIDQEMLNSYTGTYKINRVVNLKIYQKNGHLMSQLIIKSQPGNRPAYRLYPKSKTAFITSGGAKVIEFVPNGDQVSKVKFHIGGRMLTAKKVN